MMLTGRRFWTLALIVGLCALATAGCKRKRSGSTTNINGSDIFTTDNFPGAGVQANNVADDKRAMSTSGMNFRNNLQVFWNGNRGQAIIAYGADGGSSSAGGAVVHYFNGETFTPPVALRAIDSQDATTGYRNNVQAVAWLNTENHASEAAQARNGDAMVFWTTRRDFPSAPPSDDTNRSLFMTYFDVSYSEDIAHGYGFANEANTERIDAQDESGEDVVSMGLLSDGLCGQANWYHLAGNDNDYSWGDETTSVECLFVQRENDDAFVGPEDQALYTVRFDPATVTPEDQPIPGTGLSRIGIVPFGSSDSGVNADETQVDEDFITYNNTVIFRVVSNAFFGLPPTVGEQYENNVASGTGNFGDDNTLQTLSINLSTGTFSSVTALNTAAITGGDGFAHNENFVWSGHSVYGSDEGLACTVAYFVAWDSDSLFSNVPSLTSSSRLYISEISPSTGGVLEIAQLNNDDVNEVEGIHSWNVETEISRNGDYIWASWWEFQDVTVGVNNDGSGGFSSAGISANEYITTRPDSDGAFVIPSLVNSLSGPGIVASPGAAASDPISGASYQNNLGYICGIQSNADVMHIVFERSNGATDELFDARLTADLVPVGVTPGLVVTSIEVFENGDQSFFGFGRQFTDSGDGGGLFIAYGDDIDGTALVDQRVFVEDLGPTPGISEVDSAVSYRQASGPWLIATPAGQEIGTFNTVDLVDEDQRHHGAEIIHVFFNESRTSENYSSSAIRTRQFNTNTDATFTDSFIPNATPATYQEPFMIDLPNLDPSTTISWDGSAVSGNTVGVWFEFLNHVYYQEFDPNGNGNGDNNNDLGWRNINGAGDPALVDDDTAVEVEYAPGLWTMTCTCEDLDRAMFFWVKHFDGYADDRLQVRVRGTDNGNN